jgi:hypothetical protein
MFIFIIHISTVRKIRINTRQNIPSRRIRTEIGPKTNEIYVNEKRHRVNGPAFVCYYADGTILRESWYLNNKPHNLYGPATIIYLLDGRPIWWI